VKHMRLRPYDKREQEGWASEFACAIVASRRTYNLLRPLKASLRFRFLCSPD
jgi:hypothetical protein